MTSVDNDNNHRNVYCYFFSANDDSEKIQGCFTANKTFLSE